MASKAVRLVSVEYEVFGKVQGVFFRKYTQETAEKLGLVGWVKNTARGTVTGIVQGPEEKVNVMKEWLKKTGSPKSHIEKCVCSNERDIEALNYSHFVIDRPAKIKKSTKKKKS